MKEHIVVRVGENDDYLPSVESGEATHIISFGSTDQKENVRENVSRLLEEYGLTPSPAAWDLIRMAMAVYSADFCTKRKDGFNSWTRNLHLHLAVHELEKWTAASETLVKMLRFLSGDHWEISLRKTDSEPIEFEEKELEIAPTSASLFSGGLDSFIGAIDKLSSDEPLALVGHHGAGVTNSAQQNAHEAIEEYFPDKTIFFDYWVVHPSGVKSVENTMRARSILFISLGVLTASCLGERVPLFVPENGLISINSPLTEARAGSNSTRTTHPYFVGKYNELLDQLGITAEVCLPNRFDTKGEMAKGVLETEVFDKTFNRTMSCSHPESGRWSGEKPSSHCGYCVPCIIRRASLNATGLDCGDDYVLDILTDEIDNKSDKARDLRAFQMALERQSGWSDLRLMMAINDSGPIPPELAKDYLGVYKRGMEEVRQLLNKSTVSK